MRKRLLFLIAMFVAVSSFARHKKPKHPPANTPAVATAPIPEPPTIGERAMGWAQRNSMPLLMGGGGLVLVIIVIRKIAGGINSVRVARSVKLDKHSNSLFRYWYQCKHCAACVQNPSEPGTAGCTRARAHHWTKLAEVGSTYYTCRKCLATIHAKSDPSDHGCPNAVLHSWKKK